MNEKIGETANQIDNSRNKVKASLLEPSKLFTSSNPDLQTAEELSLETAKQIANIQDNTNNLFESLVSEINALKEGLREKQMRKVFTKKLDALETSWERSHNYRPYTRQLSAQKWNDECEPLAKEMLSNLRIENTCNSEKNNGSDQSAEEDQICETDGYGSCNTFVKPTSSVRKKCVQKTKLEIGKSPFRSKSVCKSLIGKIECNGERNNGRDGSTEEDNVYGNRDAPIKPSSPIPMICVDESKSEIGKSPFVLKSKTVNELSIINCNGVGIVKEDQACNGFIKPISPVSKISVPQPLQTKTDVRSKSHNVYNSLLVKQSDSMPLKPKSPEWAINPNIAFTPGLFPKGSTFKK